MPPGAAKEPPPGYPPFPPAGGTVYRVEFDPHRWLILRLSGLKPGTGLVLPDWLSRTGGVFCLTDPAGPTVYVGQAKNNLALRIKAAGMFPRWVDGGKFHGFWFQRDDRNDGAVVRLAPLIAVFLSADESDRNSVARSVKASEAAIGNHVSCGRGGRPPEPVDETALAELDRSMLDGQRRAAPLRLDALLSDYAGKSHADPRGVEEMAGRMGGAKGRPELERLALARLADLGFGADAVGRVDAARLNGALVPLAAERFAQEEGERRANEAAREAADAQRLEVDRGAADARKEQAEQARTRKADREAERAAELQAWRSRYDEAAWAALVGAFYARHPHTRVIHDRDPVALISDVRDAVNNAGLAGSVTSPPGDAKPAPHTRKDDAL